MKVLKLLDDYLEPAICAALLAVMSVLIMLQIIGRTVGFDISWNEELARYLHIWLIYIGCAYAVKMRRHIKVEIALLVLPRGGRFLLGLVSNLLFLIFALVVAYEALPILHKIHYVRKQTSPSLGIPMSYPIASVFCGFVLVSIRLVQDTVRLIGQYRKGEEI